MRVFYELTHTSCDREIMRSGYEFDALHPTWDEVDRPKPKNVRLVDGPSGRYDAAVVGTERGLSLVPAGVPVIWKCLTDYGQWPKPSHLLPRFAAWVAPCKETVLRWNMEGDPKAVVIEHGIDVDIFKGYRGEQDRVLSVGNKIPVRPEKGPEALREMNLAIPVELYGFGNEGFPGATGIYAPMLDLAEKYRAYRVYFNPCSVVVCAVLEAMATGMPVITMGAGNFTDMMRDGVNCFIAESVNDARTRVEECLSNPGLASEVGARGRESVRYRFHPAIAAHRWGRLIENVAAGRAPCDFE